MVISALVVTLDPRAVEEVVDRLIRDARLDLGDRVGNRLPVVVETATLSDARELYYQLERLAGVWSVDLVMADFSAEEGLDAA